MQKRNKPFQRIDKPRARPVKRLVPIHYRHTPLLHSPRVAEPIVLTSILHPPHTTATPLFTIYVVGVPQAPGLSFCSLQIEAARGENDMVRVGLYNGTGGYCEGFAPSFSIRIRARGVEGMEASCQVD